MTTITFFNPFPLTFANATGNKRINECDHMLALSARSGSNAMSGFSFKTTRHDKLQFYDAYLRPHVLLAVNPYPGSHLSHFPAPFIRHLY